MGPPTRLRAPFRRHCRLGDHHRHDLFRHSLGGRWVARREHTVGKVLHGTAPPEERMEQSDLAVRYPLSMLPGLHGPLHWRPPSFFHAESALLGQSKRKTRERVALRREFLMPSGEVHYPVLRPSFDQLNWESRRISWLDCHRIGGCPDHKVLSAAQPGAHYISNAHVTLTKEGRFRST